ncbi:predicted protein, partial [Arabidopsis lyrata subsp. lyrata]
RIILTSSYFDLFRFRGSPNFESWKGGISLAPGPSADDVSDYLVLAAHRTKRPDILRAFKPYHGGWNITNNHYWASVGFTGTPGFILAATWLFKWRVCDRRPTKPSSTANFFMFHRR